MASSEKTTHTRTASGKSSEDENCQSDVTPILPRQAVINEHRCLSEEKDLDNLPDEAAQRAVPLRHIPRKYQIMAFCMIIFFNTSSSFSESTLSPLKSIIRSEMKITSETEESFR
jgi:hypothetical protein